MSSPLPFIQRWRIERVTEGLHRQLVLEQAWSDHRESLIADPDYPGPPEFLSGWDSYRCIIVVDSAIL